MKRHSTMKLPRLAPFHPRVFTASCGFAWLLIGTSLASAGPDRGAPAKADHAASAGSITGVIQFEGKPPERKPVDNSSDPFCARTEQLGEEIVVSERGLQDVLVRLQGPGLSTQAPTDALLVDQVGCMYRPRVSAAVIGQPIHVRNSDGSLHNIHAYADGATVFNLAQPKGVKPIVRSFDEPGVVELKCDVHKWMRGFVAIVDNAHFSVTGAGGRFELPEVPAGEYELIAWHPVLGTKTAKVKVTAGKASKVSIAFSGKPASSSGSR